MLLARMETSVQLVTHWQSAQWAPQHPTKAPGCFYTLWGSSFTNSHWGLSLLLSEPPTHTLTRVGLALHSTWLSTIPSTSHRGQVRPLFSVLPLAEGPGVFPGPRCCVITRRQGKKSWACASAKEAASRWDNTIWGAVLCITYALSRWTKLRLHPVVLVQRNISHVSVWGMKFLLVRLNETIKGKFSMQGIHVERPITFNGSCVIQAACLLPNVVLENPFCLLFIKFSTVRSLHAY